MLCLLLLLVSVPPLNFPLTKSRETCLVVSQGDYEFEFVVSGQSEKEVRCVIQEEERQILQVMGKSEFEGEFTVTRSEAKICFSSLDSMAKSVSVDFMRLDDPLRGVIADAGKMGVHEKLFGSYQQLERVYRDQHFFLERNYIHSILLKQTEVVVVFFLLLKVMVAFLCGFFQLYFVKRILERSFTPLPSEETH